MRLLKKLAPLLLSWICVGSIADTAYTRPLDSSKPAYQLGIILGTISTYTSVAALVNDIEEARKYATTSKEQELYTLAADLLGCAMLPKSDRHRECTLKGDLSRYGPYKSLAVQLNTAQGESTGKLFRCAIDELQGVLTHTEYERCIDAHH